MEDSTVDRGVGAGWAGWACARPLFCLIFSEKKCLPTHFLLPAEQFLVLPPHFEEASDAPDGNLLTLLCETMTYFISRHFIPNIRTFVYSSLHNSYWATMVCTKLATLVAIWRYQRPSRPILWTHTTRASYVE